MIKPDFRTNFWSKLCFKLHTWLEGWKFKFIIKPILFALPITLVLAILSDSEACTQFKAFLGTKAGGFITKHHLLLTIAIIILSFVGFILRGVIEHFSQPNCQLTRDDTVAIMDNLEEIVSGKMKRFLEKTKEALPQRWTEAKIFREITLPDQQIGLLTHGIKGLFEHLLDDDTELRVGLMRIKDNKPVEWFAFAPHDDPPLTCPEVLAAPASTIMRSLKSGKTIIVEDIQKELKKRKEDRSFIKGSTSDKDNGSILSKPIHCPNTKEPIYVLSILTNKKCSFTSKKRHLYKWVLKPYLSRIILEHHLLLLKEGQV